MDEKIDWSAVPVDAPVLVSRNEDGPWEKRHFARYENGTVYAWAGGRTSWTAFAGVKGWEYAKLAEEET